MKLKDLESKLWPYIAISVVVYGSLFVFVLWYSGWIK